MTGKHAEAKQEWDRCMVPWMELIAQIDAATGGEGIFVRPAMNAVGLQGGHSRLPSRDEVITPELQAGYQRLLALLQEG
jgi:hypothetical protein